jgi:hypothetical protein
MPWPKVTITIDSGEKKEAIAPCIVSASRSTDIPAFYGQWFMRRLDAGYVRWVNPFSGKPVYVSLRQARLFVFWSKNASPFLPFLRELDRRGINYYFHITLNDYEIEKLEQGIPPLAERIDTFLRLGAMLGKERVLWRFDPLIITDTLSPAALCERIKRIGDKVAPCTGRLTVSFIALYAKVRKNLQDAGIKIRPWDDKSRTAMLSEISALCRAWKVPAVTCAEEKNYDHFGIVHGKCIDDALIGRLFHYDKMLMEFLKKNNGAKDKGQRPACSCIPSKDIGSYTTCGHQCVYCYANTSPHHAMENRRRHTIDSESIII